MIDSDNSKMQICMMWRYHTFRNGRNSIYSGCFMFHVFTIHWEDHKGDSPFIRIYRKTGGYPEFNYVMLTDFKTLLSRVKLLKRRVILNASDLIISNSSSSTLVYLFFIKSDASLIDEIGLLIS